jgi:death-on-curing protein
VTAGPQPLFLSVEDVLTLHDDQLRLFGGSAGVRDRGALEWAVATPDATFDDEVLHEDLFHMAAAYAFHIAENQPFVGLLQVRDGVVDLVVKPRRAA